MTLEDTIWMLFAMGKVLVPTAFMLGLVAALFANRNR
jgi:hypothetical protein